MKGKYKFVVITLAAVSIGCAGFSYNRSVPTPFDAAVGYVAATAASLNVKIIDKLGNTVSYFKGISRLNSENEKLKEELLSARAQLSSLKLVEQENAQLSSLLKMQEEYSDLPTIGARVIAKDPGNWFTSFLIDKGANYGLKKNMAVITAEGLVGKITECGYNYSKVVSIIDDSDAVSAQSVRTNSVGYVTADFSEEAQCKMQYSESSSDILVGDEIVTSYISEIYPRGISIGHVKKLVTDDKTSMKYAIIEPSVDFSRLDHVLVINKNTEYEFKEIATTGSDNEK